MRPRSVVEVFTDKSVDFMLEYGGSASWVLSVSSAAEIEYCVCTRNDQRPREDDGGDRPERRNEAFLVGKVSGIELVERQNDRDRYLLKFSEFAEVSVPNFRPGTTRNPVAYSDPGDCARRGLDIGKLAFKPMPVASKTYARLSDNDRRIAPNHGPGLSIAEAKAGLSIRFGVPIDAIQITISG
ncbi:MAG: hypothetical protein QOK17_1790 [Sphingomonadales bacterium]|nr:hypothetical protein [Sphingomonadales bacterium]